MNTPGRAEHDVATHLSRALSARKIPKLDALRAVSVLMVMLYHLGLTLVPAGLGVMIFFVISGFLITSLLLAEVDTSQTIDLGRFYVRRAFRILPAFYVYWVLLLVALWITHHTIRWPAFATTLLYVGNYYQGLNHYPEHGLSHTWSLGVEEQYYLLWPLLLRTFAGNRVAMFRLTCAGILVVWIWRVILSIAGVPEAYIYTSFETRADHLLVGSAVAMALRYGYGARAWRLACARTAYMVVPLLGLTASSIAALKYGTDYRDVVGFVIEPLLIAVLMTQLLNARVRGLAWMDSAPLVFLGAISYSTYLYHRLVGAGVQSLIGDAPRVMVAAAAITATFAVAALSYWLVERPMLRVRDRQWTRQPQRRGAVMGAIADPAPTGVPAGNPPSESRPVRSSTSASSRATESAAYQEI